MSTPKPHIRPKPYPHRQQSAPLSQAPLPYPQRDPPARAELDPGKMQMIDRLIFHEDDCLR